MKFTQEEFETIETLAACNYGPRDIAIYLEVNVEKFKNAWDRVEERDIEGTVRYHYDRGILMTRADIEMKMLDSARAGNVTAGQQWKKAQREQEFRNALDS